jgi:hypothetical protein
VVSYAACSNSANKQQYSNNQAQVVKRCDLNMVIEKSSCIVKQQCLLAKAYHVTGAYLALHSSATVQYVYRAKAPALLLLQL